MLNEREFKYVWLSSHGTLDLTLTRDEFESCSGQGAQDDNVAGLRRDPGIAAQLDALDPATLAADLKEYGAWDADELADHDANLSRVLWLACCDLAELPESELADYESVDC